MPIRPVTAEDSAPLLRFSETIPESDRAFFKDDRPNHELVGGWLSDKGTRLIDIEDGCVRGMVAVRRGSGASLHVGEITLLVSTSHRRGGIGRQLVEAALMRSIKHNLTHIFVEVSAEQVGTIRMFERLGFMPEAMLRDFIRDTNGDHHDLIVLTHNVETLWSESASLGLGDEV